MGRVFLLESGYNTRYLTDGLLGLTDYLRGDNAKELLIALQEKSE